MGPRKPRNYTLELTAEGERRLKIINDFLETYYSITGGNKQGLDCPHITFEVDSKDNRKDYMYFGEYEGLVLSNRPVRTENALLVQGKSDKIASIEIDTITEEEDSPVLGGSPVQKVTCHINSFTVKGSKGSKKNKLLRIFFYFLFTEIQVSWTDTTRSKRLTSFSSEPVNPISRYLMYGLFPEHTVGNNPHKRVKNIQKVMLMLKGQREGLIDEQKRRLLELKKEEGKSHNTRSGQPSNQATRDAKKDVATIALKLELLDETKVSFLKFLVAVNIINRLKKQAELAATLPRKDILKLASQGLIKVSDESLSKSQRWAASYLKIWAKMVSDMDRDLTLQKSGNIGILKRQLMQLKWLGGDEETLSKLLLDIFSSTQILQGTLIHVSEHPKNTAQCRKTLKDIFETQREKHDLTIPPFSSYVYAEQSVGLDCCEAEYIVPTLLQKTMNALMKLVEFDDICKLHESDEEMILLRF
jgi:hypothetical protein